MGLSIKTEMSIMVVMDIYKFVSTELNKRKSEWTLLAQRAGISRKTIERMAVMKNDPRHSVLMKVYELLKDAS
jgi:predicted transcriptional regulator